MIDSSVENSNKLFEILFNKERILYLNFTLLLFFLVFGTGLPWQTKSELYYQVSSDGDIVNQILFLFIFVTSLTVIIPQINNLWLFVKKEKYLALFIGICIISIIWSFDSFVTSKRAFQILILYVTVSSSLLFCDYRILLKIVRIIVTLYLLVSLFVCLILPQAIDPNFGTWRGIHDNKNGLAQMGILSLLLSLLLYKLNRRTVKNIWNYFITMASIVLVIMAGSSTAIIILFILILAGLIFAMENLFKVLKLKRFVLLFMLSFSVITLLLFFFLFRQEFILITGLFGKDLTLTGRTLFWPSLFNDFREHIFLGYGYDAYWIMGSSHVKKLFFDNSIRVNTAHNGFLDCCTTWYKWTFSNIIDNIYLYKTSINNFR